LLATDVLKAAVAEAKSGKSVELYEKAVRALAEVAPTEPEASLDSAWIQEVQRSVRALTDRLEHELRGYKNNLIKESIRVWAGATDWVTKANLIRWAMRIWETTITRLVI
jgi:COP9 signalosome complex subunit 1